ncbi:hypothetical protein QYE76_016646 [Lolium multiflorum]|uniref:DUF4283 domain-containing protein n=1 Tax=Lolium multiflorum TaxID=4521 RepID=A0AAD8VCQ7_LOLMU|nr:hypothetical protein QYE76_016646 [Lolium multiflorum]
MAEEAGGSGSAKGKEAEIEDMFSHLELNEEELDEVVISVDEAKEFQKAGRWLAIGRVLTSRNFSAEALFAKMKIVWNLSRDLICREVGENLFIFQMLCLGDWKKVVHQGPWTFRGWGVLIEDYDGLSNPESVIFDGMYVWAQIHGIPELYRKPTIVDDLSRKIGLVRETQLSPKLFFEGNYVRVRVRINVTKALMRFVTLNLPEGKKRLMIKYEKIPYYYHPNLVSLPPLPEGGDVEERAVISDDNPAPSFANEPANLENMRIQKEDVSEREMNHIATSSRASMENSPPHGSSSGDEDGVEMAAVDGEAFRGTSPLHRVLEQRLLSPHLGRDDGG